MRAHDWSGQPPADELGAVVHGPAVLAAGTGIALGLRCVLAHPGGLHLLTVLHAEGVWAEAAERARTHRRAHPPAQDVREPAQVSLRAGIDDAEGLAWPWSGSSSSGHDVYDAHSEYWLGALPADGCVRLRVAWPEAGLPETTSTLTLTGLDQVHHRVVRLVGRATG